MDLGFKVGKAKIDLGFNSYYKNGNQEGSAIGYNQKEKQKKNLIIL